MKHPNKEALYVILRSPNHKGSDGKQLVLHVQIWPGDESCKETLCFYDTNRGHMIRGERITETENSFVFLDYSNEEWEMQEVTLEAFRNNLAHFVVGGKDIAQQVKSTEELWLWYRENFAI